MPLSGRAGLPVRPSALPARNAREGDRMRKTIVDPAAEFVPAVERVFGMRPRVLDGSRAVLVGDVKLTLEAGGRGGWLLGRHALAPPGRGGEGEGGGGDGAGGPRAKGVGGGGRGGRRHGAPRGRR